MRDDGENWEILSPSEKFEQVRDALAAKGVDFSSAEISMVPKTTVKLEGKKAQQLLAMMEGLEDQEDVQNVWANFDIDAAAMDDQRAAS